MRRDDAVRLRHMLDALREAAPSLMGIAIYDRLEKGLPDDPSLVQRMWTKREIENYLCQRETLLSFAEAQGAERAGGLLFAPQWRNAMDEALRQIESALQTLGKDPWGADIKASEEFLAPLFAQFYKNLKLPNEMSKTNFHVLAAYVPKDKIADEIVQVLDAICDTAQQAKPQEQP